MLFNTADDETEPERFTSAVPEGARAVAVPVGLALELARMGERDRADFFEDLGLEVADRGGLLSTILDAAGQMLFFTVSDKEVRTWMIRQGGTALDAADGIHSDLARGFIRAETMNCDDLLRLGSEREIKAQNLMRSEPKDYVVAAGDIMLIRFSV